MERTRTIVVPIVNPDGFNTSREAGEAAGAGGGRGGRDETPYLVIPYEYQRKNCRVNNTNGEDPERGDCNQQPATGLQQFGVDPNRNYGGFWGGDGAASDGGTPPTMPRTTAATARSRSPRPRTSAGSSPAGT